MDIKGIVFISENGIWQDGKRIDAPATSPAEAQPARWEYEKALVAIKNLANDEHMSVARNIALSALNPEKEEKR